MNSIYLGQIDANVTKEGIRAYENNASALDGMSAMISTENPDRCEEKRHIVSSANAIRTLVGIAESLFGEYEHKYEECERLKRKVDRLIIDTLASK
jgi:hypothetical protein